MLKSNSVLLHVIYRFCFSFLGIGKNIRREKLEQLVPNSKTFLVQNQSMSTKVVNEMMASDICLGNHVYPVLYILKNAAKLYVVYVLSISNDKVCFLKVVEM